MHSSKSENMEKEVDIYRDTPLRYLGYANEIGEAFRKQIGHKWVLATYGFATLYVLADTTDKSLKKYKETEGDTNRWLKTAYTASDVLIWQMLASVAIPGFTINRICALSDYILKKSEKCPKNMRKWIVTSIGLSAIPFIIKPIDHGVDTILDGSLRKFAPR